MDVEFVFWGRSQLAQRLTRDDGEYAGRTLYWFGSRSLTRDWFQRKLAEAVDNLGRRYTPEANVDLPIRTLFDGLCRTPALFEDLHRLRVLVRRAMDQLVSAASVLESEDSFDHDLSSLEEAIKQLDSLLGGPPPEMRLEMPAPHMVEWVQRATEQLEALDRYLDEWQPSTESESTSRSKSPTADIRYFALRLTQEVETVAEFAASQKMAAATVKALLIDGEAGMGKSHLLADVAAARLEQNLPTVLLLGQHVDAGNPWDAFLSDLDLRSNSVDQVLGALDAAGQAAASRSLLLVDAINEGGGRRVWREYIRGFLAQIARYPHVAVCLTCRTTYLRSILREGASDDSLVRVTHRGFEGHESRAAAIYLDRYGIARPNAPFLAPEFSSPLFLKTCCEALNRQGKTSFPRGLRGIKRIFGLYVQALDEILADRLDVDLAEGIGGTALRGIAARMADEGRGGLTRAEAKGFLDELHAAGKYSESLFHHLISEGALAEDLEYPAEPGEGPQEVVRFTFQRFSDHFIAEHLLEELPDQDIASGLSPGAPLGALIRDRGNWHLRGVVEALAVQVPERYGRELIGILEHDRVPFDLGYGFLESIIWRDPTAFTGETSKWLEAVASRSRGERLWDTLLRVATEPEHPFNADRLHRILLAMDLPVRDEFWSIYLARHYWDEGDGEPESVTRTLVRWAWDSAAAGADEEMARLCAVTLTWFLTTSNRALRDQATKALVSLIEEWPVLAVSLLEVFGSVNDPYVVERLHAAVYGAVLQGMPDEEVSEIASEVYRRVFEAGSPPTHVLLRDYARGTIEYARHRGCLATNVDTQRVRPPYGSEPWPLDFPTEEEVEESEYDDIRASVMSMGDFGHYVMGDSSQWSVTSLAEGRPERHQDRVDRFRTRITEDPNRELAEAFAALAEAAASPPGVDPRLAGLLNLVRSTGEDDVTPDLPGSEALETRAKAVEEAEDVFMALLPQAEQEYFKRDIRPYLGWGSQPHRRDTAVRFDIMKERRWVWRRAHTLGWSAKRFEAFERPLPGHRRPRRLERIGKKYQWIAWHELQARLSDHLHFIGGSWVETQSVPFEGPWQLGARDIDPTLLMHSNDRDVRAGYPSPVWWRPAVIEHPDESLEERVERLWGDGGFPEVKDLLLVQDPMGREWFVLDGFSAWRDAYDDPDPRPRRDTWLRMTSFLVRRADLSAALETLQREHTVDYRAFRNALDDEAFLGEHPWRSVAVPELEEWRPALSKAGRFSPLTVPYLIPTVEYVCESGRDQSIEDRIDLRLPSEELREGLRLRWAGGRGVTFRGPDDRIVFFDPTTEMDGPPATLVARAEFLDMMEKGELALVWWIAGEKGLYGRPFAHEFFGRQMLEGVYYTDGSGIRGGDWRREQRPDASEAT